jgi:ABC-type multidrug transport system ATPase subunit
MPAPARLPRSTSTRSARPAEAPDGTAVLTDGLSKRYGETLALDALNPDRAAGRSTGYLGPNGAGKTTTIRLLLGLHRPSAGRGELFGIDAWADPVSAHGRLAYVAGEPFLWPALTGAETLAYLARLRAVGLLPDGAGFAKDRVVARRARAHGASRGGP